MIGYLRGTPVQIEDDACIIDVNGVGYYVYCSRKLLNKLEAVIEKGPSDVKLYTQLIHREDTMDLYGFLDKDEHNLFNLLLTVSGIGPKQSMKILGTRDTADIVKAIVSEDIDFLIALSGIGKKKAQQIIFTLKERVRKTFDTTVSPVSSTYLEAVTALESLGFSAAESRRAVDNALSIVESKDDVAKIVEAALRHLS
jgi:Holliday junction DNA helicase RuvA